MFEHPTAAGLVAAKLQSRLKVVRGQEILLVLFQSLLFLLLLNLAANAQDLAGLEQGIKPYGSYNGGNIDPISMATCASGATGTLYWRGLGSDTLRETDLAGAGGPGF
jgi:hypothetical protein